MSKRSTYRKFPNVSKVLQEKIVIRRKNLKMSQAILAERAGLTRNCIQQLECYEHLPLPSTMFRIIRALNFSADESAAFWLELDDAYAKDMVLQEETIQSAQRVMK